MRTSESISKIAQALLEAQRAITFASKDATNPHFKSKYADLESVISAIKGPLNEQGIVFLQSFSPSAPGTLSLTTRLLHVSGEWVEDEMTMPLQKNDAQGYGSAATYSRRYAIAAITGLYQADDDGQEAVKQQPLPTLSDSKYSDMQDSIADADDIESIGAVLKSAVHSGATKSQLERLRLSATSRKTILQGGEA